MKLVIAALIMSLLTFSALAGTFIETFNGANLKEWQELVENDKAPGSWEIVDNELHAISPNGWMRLLTIGNKKWRDYTIEFDVKPLEKHGRGNIAIAARIKKTQLVSWTIGDWLFWSQAQSVVAVTFTTIERYFSISSLIHLYPWASGLH